VQESLRVTAQQVAQVCDTLDQAQRAQARVTSVQQFARLPHHRYGNSHATRDHTRCYLPPGRGDIPARTPAEAAVLD